ncbi:DUF4249 domain-containing protein [Hyunsoonleella sp. 2307UL5-6]|uniref:DUF4249 domain-containing protein n=1 Tax=Hyunsoonleella sp. 2307UL5-6 TaxID=3384768 RepID=UPI0039BC27F2
MDLKKLYSIISALLILVNMSCVEELPLVTENFEDTIVIEATITDELKTQQIKLSRTIRLEENTPNFEANAQVRVETNNGTTYEFAYQGEGIYTSNQEFQAVDDESYTLFVQTSNGNSYVSNEEVLVSNSEIDSIYAELVNNGEQNGITVFVDSKENSSNPRFFRYEYEETYKIVAPIFSLEDLFFDNIMGSGESLTYTTRLEPRPIEQQTCYTTTKSNEIIITSINGLDENSVSRFPVRFITEQDPIIRVRYSILVKQFTQSANANNFYKVLKELSSDESLLIDIQPGFVQGNIFSQQSTQEKVLGFFDVSSVDSERIYFNHEDFNIDLPPYFFDCDVINFDELSTNSTQRIRLLRLVNDVGFKYIEESDEGLFIVNPPCGDCTIFSSSEIPSFWED